MSMKSETKIECCDKQSASSISRRNSDQRVYPLIDKVYSIKDLLQYSLITTSSGYQARRIANHINASKNGYVYEHRLVMSAVLGRNLLKNEIVHHLDGDKHNNKPENLLIHQSIASHKSEHRKANNTLKNPLEENIEINCACGCGERLMKYDNAGRLRKYIAGHNRKGTGKKNSSEVTKCACGCGLELKRYDSYGRKRSYISGHNLKKCNGQLRKVANI